VERLAATFGSLVILAVLAGGLTEATMALGGRGSLANDILLRPLKLGASPSVSPSTTPKPTVSATPSPTPVATPAPTPAVPTATTNSYPIVHMRVGKSASTAIVTDLNGGTVVQLLSDSDAQWQQVRYNGFTGYIYKIYLTY